MHAGQSAQLPGRAAGTWDLSRQNADYIEFVLF
jgi:hypothetical protein